MSIEYIKSLFLEWLKIGSDGNKTLTGKEFIEKIKEVKKYKFKTVVLNDDNSLGSTSYNVLLRVLDLILTNEKEFIEYDDSLNNFNNFNKDGYKEILNEETVLAYKKIIKSLEKTEEDKESLNRLISNFDKKIDDKLNDLISKNNYNKSIVDEVVFKMKNG